MMFNDRRDAGRKLARALERFKSTNPLVLALPRGGVPVGFEVAGHLRAPLDLLLVRKIGAPGHEELALGAVVDGLCPQVVVNQEIVDMIQPPRGYFEAAEKRELAEIERRRRLYLGAAQPIDVKGRVAIIVDDGIATGATMKAALRGVRQNKPSRIVLAAPVAPQSVIRDLKEECDEMVFLATPEPFYAVGLYYADFSQTTDEEVIELLGRRQSFTPAPRKDGEVARSESQSNAAP
jgi:putative phosphoribosyl transferase